MLTTTPPPTGAGRPPREVLERERETFEAEHRHLALHDPAGSRIAAVRERLQVLAVWLHETALAERQVHDETVQTERDAQQARDDETHARLETFEAVEIPAAAADADATGTAHARSLARLAALQDHADRLRARLGITSRRRTDALAVEGAVTWMLRDIFPAAARNAAFVRFRKPLAELFAPAAPPAEEGP